MKGLRKKFRRGLAAFLAFVLTMTSVNTVSLADVSNALETEKATFVMSGEDIVESAQAAIDNGSTFTYEDLGIEETGSTAKEYQKLFTNGTVYEIAPSYDLDEEENADGANLRMFIRVKGETEGYQITGEEEIIFLYINDSESKIAFRSRIDDYVTDKVTVKGNSSLAETEKPVLDENGNAIEGDKPAQTPEESTVPSGETGSVEETKEPETEAPAQVPEESMQEPESEVPTQEPETTAPAEEPKTEAPTQAETEKPTQAPVQEPETQAPVQEPETQAPETDAATQAPEVQEPDTEAPAQEPEPEAPAQEPEAADTGNETASIIRNNTYVLTTAIEPTSEESDVSIVDEEVPKADSPKEDTEANTPADNPVSVSTGSNADKGDHADHEENKPSEKIEGKTYGHVLLNEESYAKAYVTTLDKMGISVEAAEGLTLAIHHNAFYNDKDISEDEVIRGLKEGDVINPADYAWDKDFLTYAGSSQDNIVISSQTENRVDLYYNAIAEEKTEDEVTITGAIPRSYFRSAKADDNTTPGKVFPTKTAEWVDEANGIGKIDFTIYGNPIRRGSDVVLVIDSSGSMEGEKWSTAKKAAKGFIDNLYQNKDGVVSDDRIAIVDFDSSAKAYPGTNNGSETFLKVDDKITVNKNNYSATNYFKSYVLDSQMKDKGGTDYDKALQTAQSVINNRKDSSRPAYIVFMSDGEPNGYNYWFEYYYYDGQDEAEALKNDGVTIYSLGLNIGSTNFNKFIVPLASDPASTYAKNIVNTSDLVGIYDAIASSIKIAGTEATITDVINTEAFEIATDYNDGIWYEASTGTVSKSSDNKTVTWDFGNISANKETLTIYIKVKDTVPGGTAPDTNKEAKVDYTDPNEQSQTQDIPSPNLAVGDVGTITLNYYLVNEDGITINGTGEAIDFARRQQLGTKLYGDAPQEFGSYTVNAPSTIEYNGIKYQYVAASASKDGSANPANVELSPAKKAVNLYYGYQEIKDVTVTFHGNGGTPSVSSVTVPKDTALGGQIATAVREDHNFLGWNTAMDGSGSAFTSNTIVTDNITVYAQWQKKQALTIKAADTEKVYNGEMQYASETGYESTGLKAGHRITNIKASGSGRDVKEDGYPITITGSVKVVNESGVDVTHEYTITKEPGTLTIKPKEVTITVDNSSKAYGSPDPKFTGKVEGLVNETDLGTVSFVRINEAEEVGVYEKVLAAKYKANKNYTVTEHRGDFEIKVATMPGASLSAKGGSWEYDGNAHYAAATLNKADGYTVYYKVNDGDWTVNPPSVTEVSEGIVTVSVKATKYGYVDLETENVTLQITPKPVTITVKNAEKTFGESDPTFEGTVQGLVNSTDLGTVTYKRSNDTESVGTYIGVLIPEYKENTNYKITVKPGDFKINPAKDPEADLKIAGGSWPYDGKEHKVKLNVIDSALAALKRYTIEYSTDGGQTWSKTVPGVTNVSDGTLTVIARGTREGYETLKSNEVTISITPAPVTIVVDNAEKFYNDPDPAFTGKINGLVKAGDLGNVTYSRTNADEEVGVYQNVLTANFYINNNYTVKIENGDFEIKSASLEGAVLTAVGGEWTYDGNAHAATAALENAPGYTIYYKTGNGDWTTEAPSVTNVADGLVTVSVKAERHGYEALEAEDVTLKILPKEVIIQVKNAEKFFDEPDPKFEGTVSALVNQEDLGTVTYTRENTEEAVGIYNEVLTANYTSNGNYEVTIKKGDFEIKTATLEGASLSAAGGSWTYDGKTHYANAELTNADNYTIYYRVGDGEWTTEIPGVTNVSEGELTVSVKAARTGYVDLVTEDVKLVITPRDATITVNDAEKFYDEKDPSFTGTETNLVKAGDLGTVTYRRTNDDEEVGTYEEVLTADYTANDNYKVTVVNADFTIKTASIAGAKLTAAGGSWIYDGEAHAAAGRVENADGYTVYYKVGDGEWTTEVPSVTNVLDGIVTVSVKATRTGYEELTTDAVALEIIPKDAAIVVDDAEKFYDEADPKFTGTVTGLVKEGDLEGLTYIRTNKDEAVGIYPEVLAAAYIENANYNVTEHKGTFEIKTATMKDAKVTADGGSWVYDGAAHAATASLKNADGYTVYYKAGDGEWTTTAPSVTNVAEGIVTVSVKATKTGYTDLTAEDVTIQITKKPATITVNNAEKFFNEADPAFTGTVTKLVADGDLGTITYVRTNDAAGVGTYEKVLDAVYTDNTNYEVTVKRGDFKIKEAKDPEAELKIVGGSWVYDGDEHRVKLDVIDSVLAALKKYKIEYSTDGGNTWSETVPGVTNVADGTVTVIARGTREGYETLVSNETTIQITARTATIRVHDAEKFFDESDPAFTGTEENLVKAGDLGTVTYRRTNADEAVGTYPEVLTADYTANGNYIVNVVNGDFEIKTASIKDAKLEAAGGSWIYDGAAHAASGNVTNADGYTVYYKAGNGEWTTEAPSVTNVLEGTVTVSVKAVRSGYADLTTEDVTLKITPREAVITVDHAEKYFDEQDPEFTGKAANLVASGDLGTITYRRTNTEEAVGTYPKVLTADYESNSNYIVTVVKGDFAIKTAFIEDAELAAAGGSWTYDGAAHAATAKLKNAPGYTIYYKAGNGEWSTVAPNVTNVSEGLVTVSVKATKTGYEDLTTDDVTLQITPKTATITVDNAEKFFDEEDPAFTGTVTDLVNESDLGTVSYKRTNAEEAVGIYKEVLTAEFTDNSNYNVIVQKGDFQIKTAAITGAALTAAGGSWVYDGNAHRAEAIVENADGYTIYYKTEGGTWSTEVPSVTNVSDGKVTVSVMAVKTGYEDLNTEDVTLEITPRDATIVVDDAEKFFDEKDPVFTGTKNNLIKEEDLGTVTYRRTNTAEEVRTYPDVLTADYVANSNYHVTVVNGDFTIKTASISGAELTAAGGSWIYDGEAHAAAGRVENADGYTVYYKVGDGEWTTEVPSVTNVLDGIVTVSVKATRTGYEELTTDAVALEIIPKDAAIVVDDAEKFYDEADPKFTGTVTGLVKEGDLEGLTYIRTNKDEAVGIYPEVLAAAYIENANYNVTEHKGTFEIKTATMKDAKVTADGGSWVYDGAAHAATASLKNADGYTVYYKAGDGEWTTTAPSVTNVAEGIVTVSVKATKTGYTDLTAEDVTIQITKKPATITVNNAEKFFNEADPAFTGTVTKLVADGDLGTITYVRTNDAAGVGTYEKVLDAVYTDNTNYEVTVKRGDFKIKEAKDPEAELKIVGGSWVYDGDEHRVKLDVIDSVLAALKKYKIEYSTDGGNTWSETVPGVTNVADGTVTVIARGTREGYETLVSNETTIQITARTATIRVHDAEKFFDESDPAFTGTEENLVKAGDLGTVTYRRTNADEAVGTYPEVLTADYTANGNYIVNVVNGDFEIKTASIKDAKLEAAGGSWIYDGAAHAASGNVTNADGYTVYYKAGNGEWTTEAPSVTNVLEGTVTVSVKAVRSGYADLTTEDVTLKITPREAVITVDHAEKYFDEQDPEFTGKAANLVASGDLGTITYRRTNTEEAVGTYPKVLTADYESNSNYIVTVVKGDFAIKTAFLEDAVLTAAGGSWTYDGAAHEAAARLEHAPGYTIYYKAGNGEWSTEAPSVTNVADGTVTVSVKATKTGYEDLTAEDVTIRITARPATIVVDNKSKSYSDIDPLFTGQIQGLISDGDLGTVVYHRLDADKNKEAVGADITLTASYSDNSNYKVEVKNGKLNIIALNTNTVNVTGETVTYDGKTHGLREVTALKEGSTILYSVDNQNFSETVPVFTEAGSHTVYVKAVNPNYHDTAVVTGIVVIQKRALSITAASAERKYNGTELTAPTASITDGTLADGQTLTAVKVTGSQTSVGSSENIASDAVIMADNGEVTSNYNITYLAGTLRVTSGSSGGGGGGGGNTPNPDKPYVPEGPGTDSGTVTIEPGEVPLANLPESSSADNLVLIDDGNVPLAGLPKTGDRAGAHAGLAALLSGFLLAAFTALSSKKREEEK